MKLILFVCLAISTLSYYSCSYNSTCTSYYNRCYYCSSYYGYCVKDTSCCAYNSDCSSGYYCSSYSYSCTYNSSYYYTCTSSSSCGSGYYCSYGSCILSTTTISTATSIASGIWFCYIGIPILIIAGIIVGIVCGVRRCMRHNLIRRGVGTISGGVSIETKGAIQMTPGVMTVPGQAINVGGMQIVTPGVKMGVPMQAMMQPQYAQPQYAQPQYAQPQYIQQPMVGYAQQPIGYAQQPVMGYQQPMMGYQQPVQMGVPNQQPNVKMGFQ